MGIGLRLTTHAHVPLGSEHPLCCVIKKQQQYFNV